MIDSNVERETIDSTAEHHSENVQRKFSNEECVEALRKAARQLGKSPGIRDYRKLGISPSAKTLEKRFGSWYDAKTAAGLEAFEQGRNPDFVKQQGKVKDVNDVYFAEIDSPEKAYWLGFIFGDGCIHSPSKGRYTLFIDLHKKDHKLLEKFKHAVDSKHKLRVRSNRPHVSFSIGSNEFCKNLVDKGVVPKKTHKGTLPNIDERLHPHFMRGYSDADGCFTLRKRGSLRWSLTSASLERLEKTAEWFPSEIDISPRQHSSGYHGFDVSGKRAQRVAEWFYQDGGETSPCLRRKLNVVLKSR